MSASLRKSRVLPRLYDADFYAWTRVQAAALQSGRVSELDLSNLAEEIGDLGKAEFGKLESALRVLLTHMLKWDHQPERRSRSWANSIATQRVKAGHVLRDNPSLRPRLEDAVERAFSLARLKASTEMRRNVSTLPEACPYSFAEMLERSFDWPEA